MRTYLGLFTIESWREFKAHGGNVMGFTEAKVKTAGRLEPGDLILCYLSKVSAFVAVMRVIGPSYQATNRIWSDGLFPVRLPVEILKELPLHAAVSIHSLRGKLHFLPRSAKGAGWTIYVRSSPRLWQQSDGKAVIRAIDAKLRSRPVAGTSSSEAIGGSLPMLLDRALPETSVVGRTVKRTSKLFAQQRPRLLGSYESVLSFNKVTGYSVNFPIATTCKPTAVCFDTCYFAKGAPSWRNSLLHQYAVFSTLKADPVAFAERVALEYDQKQLTFLRWNGGGDLFAESVTAINYLASIRPDIVLWVVTRIAHWAAQIEQSPNVFVHFSLDRHSMRRLDELRDAKPKSQNVFFTYQCDVDEVPPEDTLRRVSLFFFDCYKAIGHVDRFQPEQVCPLNGSADISNTCEHCRRCFDGSAVSYQRNHTDMSWAGIATGATVRAKPRQQRATGSLT